MIVNYMSCENDATLIFFPRRIQEEKKKKTNVERFHCGREKGHRHRITQQKVRINTKSVHIFTCMLATLSESCII